MILSLIKRKEKEKMLECLDFAFQEYDEIVFDQLESLFPLVLALLIKDFLPSWHGFGHRDTVEAGSNFSRGNHRVFLLDDGVYCTHRYASMTNRLLLSRAQLSGNILLSSKYTVYSDDTARLFASRLIVGLAHGYLCAVDSHDPHLLHFLNVSQVGYVDPTEVSSRRSYEPIVSPFMEGNMACLLLPDAVLCLNSELMGSDEWVLPHLLTDSVKSTQHSFQIVNATCHPNEGFHISLWQKSEEETGSTLYHLRQNLDDQKENLLVIQSVTQPSWMRNATKIVLSNGFYLVVQEQTSETTVLLCTLEKILFQTSFNLSVTIESWFWAQDVLHILVTKECALYHYLFANVQI
jgi:hypothetical protein